MNRTKNSRLINEFPYQTQRDTNIRSLWYNREDKEKRRANDAKTISLSYAAA